MDVLGIIGIIAGFIAVIGIMNLRGKAWQDFISRMTEDQEDGGR